MLLTNSQYEHLMSHYYHQQLKDNFILKKRMKLWINWQTSW